MILRHTHFIFLFIAASATAPSALSAQGWRVEASAGRAVSDPVQSRVSSNTAALGVEYGDSASGRWLYLQAGTPLNGGGPGWGAGGVGTWLGVQRGGFGAGASLGAHAFGYGAADSVASGGGVTLVATPTVTFTRGPARAELASGVIYNTDLVSGGSSTSRAVSESSARLMLALAEGVQLSGEGRFLHASDGDWPYAGGSLQVEHGRFGGWAYAGEWGGSDVPPPRTAYGAGASLRYGGARLEVGVRQEPMDPVYLSTPRRTWSVQLSHRIGPAPRRAAAPPPGILPAAENGLAVFRVDAKEHPQPPVLVGDFSGWQPVPMAREGDAWVARVRLDPGAHHYGFKDADGTFFVPAGVPTADDGFGGVSAVMVVP